MKRNNFGELLLKLRRTKEMTQTQLAQKIEVTKNTIYFWESGRCYPDIVSLQKLRQLFGDEIMNYQIEISKKNKN